MAAGYSHRSAAEKLGVKPGSRIRPAELARRHVGIRAVAQRTLRDTDRLVRGLRSCCALDRVASTGTGHISDVTENLLREVFLPRGLVDVKVAAIDEDWSGLRFVHRKKHRSA